MAIFRFQIKSVGRSARRNAVSSAAYRAGERLHDEQVDKVFNHSSRKDVLHKEIFLPSKLDGAGADWALDRSKLWNTAEQTEKRSNSIVAREYEANLPSELNPEQRLALARGFSRELADRYGVAVDLALHEPRKGSDQRNFHAHLLTTTREVTPTGLGAKTGIDRSYADRLVSGLPSGRAEFFHLRERWATHVNDALRAANVEARVDHRSLAAQGIDREPVPNIPTAALKMEKAGVRSEVAEQLRAEYRARVDARIQRAAELARSEQAAPSVKEALASPKTFAEIHEQNSRDAVKAWLRFRAEEAKRESGKVAGHERPREHDADEKTSPAEGRRKENDYGL
jgi:ATP-dependent exoDNAse (exonuclease V) alpha subunit